MVPYGLGAWKGMPVQEHFEWSQLQPHPGETEVAQVDDAVDAAVRYECENDGNEVDKERRAIVLRWLEAARALQGRRESELWRTHPDIRQLVGQLHPPLRL